MESFQPFWHEFRRKSPENRRTSDDLDNWGALSRSLLRVSAGEIVGVLEECRSYFLEFS